MRTSAFPVFRGILLSLLLGLTCTNVYATLVNFTAVNGTNTANGFFQWEATDPILFSISDANGNGKILWQISGGISLNSQVMYEMSDVVLEMMDNWYIDAPVPNSMIGDQITLFGTAPAVSGLYSVQNFYFRDETGEALDSIRQPVTQEDFAQFKNVRVDLSLPNQDNPVSFELTRWEVVPEATPVPEPACFFLLATGLIAMSVINRIKNYFTQSSTCLPRKYTSPFVCSKFNGPSI